MKQRRRKGEGGLSNRKDGRAMGRVDLGRDPVTGKRRRRYYYGEAAPVAKKLMIEGGRKATGHLIPAHSKKVRDVLEAWYKLRRSSQGKPWAPSTLRGRRAALDNYILPAFGHMRIDRLEPLQVQTWIDGQAGPDGLVPQGFLQVLQTFRTALGVAQRWQLVTYNAAKLTTLPALKPKRKIRTYSPAEAALFIEACRTHRYGALYAAAIGGGLRLGEACGIAWPNLDLDTGWLNLTHQVTRHPKLDGVPSFLMRGPLKTETSQRRLRLPKGCCTLLRLREAAQRKEKFQTGATWANPDQLVFTCASTGGLPDPFVVRRELKALCEAHDLPLILPHWLRHSTVGILMGKGTKLEEISKLLGHASLGVTNNTYGHLQTETAEAAAEKMEGIF